jgi:hypothetical protein
MKTILLLPVLMMTMLPAAYSAELTGRLFYTPDQRVQLDQLRRQKAVASQARDEPIPETVTYNGIIRRSDGKTTIWMNNQQMSDADLRSGQSVTGTVSRDGRIVLQNPQAGSGAKLELKVGQSATLLSGKVDESFSSQRAPTAAKDKPADMKAAAETPKPPQVPGSGSERPTGGIPEPVSR